MAREYSPVYYRHRITQPGWRKAIWHCAGTTTILSSPSSSLSSGSRLVRFFLSWSQDIVFISCNLSICLVKSLILKNRPAWLKVKTCEFLHNYVMWSGEMLMWPFFYLICHFKTVNITLFLKVCYLSQYEGGFNKEEILYCSMMWPWLKMNFYTDVS